MKPNEKIALVMLGVCLTGILIISVYYQEKSTRFAKDKIEFLTREAEMTIPHIRDEGDYE